MIEIVLLTVYCTGLVITGLLMTTNPEKTYLKWKHQPKIMWGSIILVLLIWPIWILATIKPTRR